MSDCNWCECSHSIGMPAHVGQLARLATQPRVAVGARMPTARSHCGRERVAAPMLVAAGIERWCILCRRRPCSSKRGRRAGLLRNGACPASQPDSPGNGAEALWKNAGHCRDVCCSRCVLQCGSPASTRWQCGSVWLAAGSNGGEQCDRGSRADEPSMRVKRANRTCECQAISVFSNAHFTLM